MVWVTFGCMCSECTGKFPDSNSYHTIYSKPVISDGLDKGSTRNATKKRWKDDRLNNILFFFARKFKYINSDVFHVGLTDHSLIYAVRMINSLPKCNGKGKSKLEISKTLTVNFFSKTYKLNPGRIYLFTKLMWLQCGAFGRLCSLKCSTDTPLSGQKVWEMGPAFRVV